jgi:MFS family permease
MALYDRPMFRALRHANYRLFFFGQGVSLVGVWMQQIAEVWLAYRLTHSPFYLGVVGFAGQIPIFLLAPYAGVWIDRVNRHRLLILTQIAQMALAFLLAGLTLTGHINLAGLIILSVIGGVVDAVDIPVRQSFVVRMVEDRADLPNAIALNSSLVNVARLAGPSVAGFIIAAVGEGWCFLLNGVSFFAVLYSLGKMRVPPEQRVENPPSIQSQLSEGLAYVRRSPAIKIMLTVLAALSLITSANGVLIPIFADRILHGGPHALGFLMASSGLGALTAALTLAARRTVLGLGRWIAFAALSLGTALLLFSFSRMLWLSMVAIALAGFSMMTGTASINTVLQTIVEEDKRGRVMSFFASAFIGMAPLGNFAGGVIAERIGAPWTVRGGGTFSLLCGLAVILALPTIRRHIRPIYIKLGILPEVATGLRAATTIKPN